MTFSIHHFHSLQHTINFTHAHNSPALATLMCIRTETGSWINTVWPAKMVDDDAIIFFTEVKQTRCRTCKVVKLHVSTIIQKEDVSIYNHISLVILIKDTAFSCTITSSFFYMHLFLSAFALQAKAIPSVDIRTTHNTSSIGFIFF